MYRCVAPSVRAFVQQVAVGYVRHGYLWYVQGKVPLKKNPAAVDQKLVAKYGIDLSDSARARRKKKGLANFQYIRHDRFFLLVATQGERDFFEAQEGKSIQHVYQTPVRYGGYSISYRNGHPSVRLDKRYYEELRAGFLGLALRRSVEQLRHEFSKLRFQPFRPVKSQLWKLVDDVNAARKQAGLEVLPYTVLGQVLQRVRGPLVTPSAIASTLKKAASDCPIGPSAGLTSALMQRLV